MIRTDWSCTSMHCHRSDHELYSEVLRAREKADAKHGANSIEQIAPFAPAWLSILVEELGEIAHELTYDSGGSAASVRRELIDLLAVASAWVDAIDSTK